MSKKNRRAMRRALLSLSMMLVVAFVAVTGTIAWLTSTSGEVVNTFTVGQVKIELDETDTDNTAIGTLEGTNHEGRDLANDYHLVPGSTRDKDPIVWVDASSDKAYVFLKVTNGLNGAEAANVTDDPATEADETVKNIDTQIQANGWSVYKTNGNETVYSMVFDPANAASYAKDVDYKFATFTTVKISDTLDNDAIAAYANATINVKAYAIQFNDIADIDEAWNNVKDL